MNYNNKPPQYVIDRYEALMNQYPSYTEQDYIDTKHSFHTNDPNFDPYFDNPDDFNDIKKYSADIYYNGEGLWCIRVIDNDTLEESFFNKENFEKWCNENNINYLKLEYPTEND